MLSAVEKEHMRKGCEALKCFRRIGSRRDFLNQRMEIACKVHGPTSAGFGIRRPRAPSDSVFQSPGGAHVISFGLLCQVLTSMPRSHGQAQEATDETQMKHGKP